MSDTKWDIELRILSQPCYLCVARAAVSALLERLGYDEADTGKVILAIDEALANVIRHGYDNRPDGPIWLRFNPTVSNGDRAGFIMVIEDEAKQVDPAAIKSRDLEDIRPGGLGVHIIHQVMDEVEYAPRREGGMRLTMTKHPSPLNHPPTQGNTSS